MITVTDFSLKEKEPKCSSFYPEIINETKKIGTDPKLLLVLNDGVSEQVNGMEEKDWLAACETPLENQYRGPSPQLT